MESLIRQPRRNAFIFRCSGVIDISASVARSLSISEGDVIDKKIAQDINSYYEKYDRSTWQYYKLDEYYSIAYNYYNAVENGEDSSILKKEYDDYKNALDNINIQIVNNFDYLQYYIRRK